MGTHSDPTADAAIARVTKQEKRKKFTADARKAAEDIKQYAEAKGWHFKGTFKIYKPKKRGFDYVAKGDVFEND